MGRLCLDLIHSPLIDEQLQDLIRRIEAGNMDVHSVNSNRTKDGRIIKCEWFNTPLMDPQGEFGGVISLAQDVSEREHIARKLKQSESLLAEAQQVAHVGSWNWDIVNNAVFWSDEHYRIFGLEPQENALPLEFVLARVHPDDRPSVQKKIEQAFRDRQPYECRMRVLHQDGAVRFVQSRGQIEFNEACKPIRMFGTVQDITERHHAEAALRASEDRYRRIVETAEEGIWVTDASWKTTFVNARMARMLGFAQSEMVGRHVFEFMDEEARDIAMVQMDQLERGVRETLDFRMLRRDGAPVWAIVAPSPTFDEEGRFIGALAMVTDITERKRSEEELTAGRLRLELLSRQLLSTQEAERRRLARELHDEVGQALTAIKMNLQAVQRAPTASESAARLNDSMEVVSHVLEQVRTLSLEYWPTILDDLGLGEALEWYVDRQARRWQCKVQLVRVPREIAVPSEVGIACFRVVQEALTSVARHARARNALVEVRQGEIELHLAVRDDGVGFDTAATFTRMQQGQGLGLMSMRERVFLLGGQVDISSSLTHGTVIQARFPLSRPEQPS